MTCGIYKISNTANEAVYVGSSLDIESRHKQHKIDLRGNRHHCVYLQRAWNKYGSECFRFELLEVCDREDLLKHEQSWMDEFSGQLYNSRRFAERAGAHSEETKQRISQSLKGRSKTPAHIEAMRAAPRRAPSEESNLKRSLASFGRKHTDEAKKKISDARKQDGICPPSRKGVKLSEETKLKISLSKKKARIAT